jgi:hypothetical protein
MEAADQKHAAQTADESSLPGGDHPDIADAEAEHEAAMGDIPDFFGGAPA